MMSDYNLLIFGDVHEYLTGFGFASHPTGSGPLDEFVSCAILPDHVKVLLPGGLCFSGTLSNHAKMFEDLSSHPSRWELHFCWETKLPLIAIVVPELETELIVALSPDNEWAAGYAPLMSGYDHFEWFELLEWTVPEELKGKVISVTSPESFGTAYC